MARVPRLGWDTSGYARRDQAIMEAARSQAAAMSQAGRDIGLGLMRAATSYRAGKEAKLDRQERASARADARAERAADRGMRAAELDLRFLQADVALSREMRDRAQSDLDSLQGQAMLNPAMAEDPAFQERMAAAQGSIAAADDQMLAMRGRAQAIRGRMTATLRGDAECVGGT